MSIATMRGDGGETGLAGGIRVSKSNDRVEAYGTIDELISTIGFARSICGDEEVAALGVEEGCDGLECGMGDDLVVLAIFLQIPA